MVIVTPTTDFIRASLLTADGDIVQRLASAPARFVQSMAVAVHSGGFSLTGANWKNLNFDTEVVDREGDYTPGTGYFLVPADGLYLCFALLGIQGNCDDNDYFSTDIVCDTHGTRGAIPWVTSGANNPPSGTHIKILAETAGHNLYFRVYCNDATPRTLNGTASQIGFVQLIGP